MVLGTGRKWVLRVRSSKLWNSLGRDGLVHGPGEYTAKGTILSRAGGCGCWDLLGFPLQSSLGHWGCECLAKKALETTWPALVILT